MTKIVEMQGITKAFPGIIANDDVHFDLERGEIHALLGENGAGKTTLMNILYGLYTPDKGKILINGEEVRFSTARDAIAHGLGMVHQHFMLVQRFTVAENIILGQKSPRFPIIEDMKQVNDRLTELSNRYGLTISPTAVVRTLSVGEQQRVEILKALYRGADVLILDEPTAVLTPQEVEDFLKILKKLTDEGKSIIFITHKLNEVLSISDRVTVLRDGKNIGMMETKGADEETLARMMVGREVLFHLEKKPLHAGAPMLSVSGLCAKNDRGLDALKNVSFEIRAGEILGIAGVDGNGQSELEQVIAGLRPAEAGNVTINGQDVTNRSPKTIGEAGLAHIPSDRYKMGLISAFSVAENSVLERVEKKPFTHNGLLDLKAIFSEGIRLVKKFDVRTPSIQTKAGKLSGGNAQKLILARELARKPKCLIAAQPTRGLDVSAIEYVHQQLLNQRDEGVAVLLFSTELTEILQLSDRIAVMYNGEIVGVLDAENVDVLEIGLMMTGAKTSIPETEAAL